MLKPELYELVKANKPPPVYLTDRLANEAGHEVLRTPPRQCQLNSIELIWSPVKGSVSSKNTTMRLKDVLDLTKAAVSEVTQEQWAKVVSHTIKVEEEHWRLDNLVDEVDPLIIPLGLDSDASSSSGSEDED